MNEVRKSAVVGGGCFWCVEDLYQRLPGVESVISGYAGGHVPDPTYEQVCGGRTGHAEVVLITYDPSQLDFRRILELFWLVHDPTTLNRQGADVGTQYRSVIFYSDAEEMAAAEASRAKAQAGFPTPIVTEISPLETFYPAENYHQDFATRNPGHPYICATLPPKLSKFLKALESE